VQAGEGVRDFAELEPAVRFARQEAADRARELALRAGAAAVQVSVTQADQSVEVAGDRLFLGSEIVATAAGRPRLQAAG